MTLDELALKFHVLIVVSLLFANAIELISFPLPFVPDLVLKNTEATMPGAVKTTHNSKKEQNIPAITAARNSFASLPGSENLYFVILNVACNGRENLDIWRGRIVQRGLVVIKTDAVQVGADNAGRRASEITSLANDAVLPKRKSAKPLMFTTSNLGVNSTGIGILLIILIIWLLSVIVVIR